MNLFLFSQSKRIALILSLIQKAKTLYLPRGCPISLHFYCSPRGRNDHVTENGWKVDLLCRNRKILRVGERWRYSRHVPQNSYVKRRTLGRRWQQRNVFGNEVPNSQLLRGFQLILWESFSFCEPPVFSSYPTPCLLLFFHNVIATKRSALLSGKLVKL